MRRPPLWVRKLIRPFIPDPVMARFRLAEHSRQVRTNVDVFTSGRTARRWLAATPDTYRVREPIPGPPPPPPAGIRVLPEAGGQAATAAYLLNDPDIDVGVVAEVAPPRLAGRRRTEPRMAPVAIAARADAWDEVGGAPPGPAPLPGLLARLRAGGRRIGLVPVPPAGAPIDRTDPISAPGVVVFSLVPMHDVGGGSRGAQMTLELLRRGYHVTFVAMYGTAESVDLGLRYVHPLLEQVRLSDFDAERLASRAAAPELALAEMPVAEIVAPLESLRAAGYAACYDLIDDWSAPALGGDWYRSAVEDRVVGVADALIASASDLVVRLERYGRPVTLVPNGVNESLFGGDPGPAPDDLPSGRVLGYHGSLDGDWFDWDTLAAVAEAHPDADVVVIGDTKSGTPPLPRNVLLLGLKPQAELPAYLARFDAGLLPFVVSEATHAVSPLKVYEYLAAGVPVAAPPLRALSGLDGVHTATDLPDAVAAALRAPRPDRAAALRQHSWGARLDAVFAAVGAELSPVAGAGATVFVRPAEHYPAGARRL